jgi:hypothetical protein
MKYKYSIFLDVLSSNLHPCEIFLFIDYWYKYIYYFIMSYKSYAELMWQKFATQSNI